jgi:hypothetical protein
MAGLLRAEVEAGHGVSRRGGLLRACAACAIGASSLLAGETGCAPQFRHLDGSPFIPLGPPVQLADGWIVVDSCATGVHALVDLQTEALPSGGSTMRFERVAFRLVRSASWSPSEVRVDGPFCSRNGPPPPAQAGGTRPIVQVNRAGRPPCSFVVRAQFTLDRRPASGDSVTLVEEGRAVELVWP